MAHDIRGFFCVSWLKGFGIGRCGLQIYDPMSQEGHVRKKGVVSVFRTIFNTSNKGIANHHIDKRKLIQLIKPEFLFNSYVSTKSFRGFFLYLYLDLILNFITSEDITLFVYIGFDIKTSFSTFQTVVSLLTRNINTVRVWLKIPIITWFVIDFILTQLWIYIYFKYRINWSQYKIIIDNKT